MNIDGIKNGIVLDHITAGRAMDIYNTLEMGELDCSIAIIKNVESSKMGRKDILKVDTDLDINLDVLAFIDPGITVNIIHDWQRVAKKELSLPQTMHNVISCKNPRCITSTEQEVEQIFVLANEEKGTYRCRYCETIYSE